MREILFSGKTASGKPVCGDFTCSNDRSLTGSRCFIRSRKDGNLYQIVPETVTWTTEEQEEENLA